MGTSLPATIKSIQRLHRLRRVHLTDGDGEIELLLMRNAARDLEDVVDADHLGTVG
ncbi:MAG: hypothetical protein MZU95_14380 [Desulfomicrobium escambiense]|nr:hypothetical protein [Desulfomicrobium escambiense]